MAGVKEYISNNLSFFKGWAVYLPFLILVLCNFLDQYYFTYEGAAAMKSYTLSMPVYWIVVGIGTCISAIMSSIIKKHLADGNQEAMNKSASNALVYTVVFSLIVSAVVFLGVLPLVYSYTETDVGDNIFDFLSPIMALNFALALNMVMTGMLAVLGETKKYVTCLVVTLVAELTIDPFFIFFWKMGVMGNGLGTVCCLSISGILALYWILAKKTPLRISWRLVNRSLADFHRAAKGIVSYMAHVVFQQVGELIVRMNLYLTYSLSYGIPVLYTSFVAIVGGGTAASTAPEYRRLYAENDIDGAYSLFKRSVLETFIIMAILSALLFTFDDALILFMVNHASLEESTPFVVWTLDVLCVSAPFLGLRAVCSSVFVDRNAVKKNVFDNFIFAVIRTAVLVYAIGFDFFWLIYLLTLERFFIGVIAVYQARHYILSKKKAVPPVTADNS